MSRQAEQAVGADAIQHVVVGASDLDASLRLYRDHLGLEVLRPLGRVPEAESALWGLPDGADVRAVTLGMAGASAGLVRLASFGSATGTPVRGEARPFDSSPKNLDYKVEDLDRAYRELSAAGYRFRSEPVRYMHDGHEVGEVQMLGPDFVNVVLVQYDQGPSVTFTPKGFAGVTQWVLTVGDMARAVGLFRDVLGVQLHQENRLTGPAIEKMVGLPPGAALEVTLLGTGGPYGRIELVHYDGVQARDFTADARPPRAGMLQVAFRVPDLDAASEALRQHGLQEFAGPVECLDPVGSPARAASFLHNSGLLLELWGN